MDLGPVRVDTGEGGKYYIRDVGAAPNAAILFMTYDKGLADSLRALINREYNTRKLGAVAVKPNAYDIVASVLNQAKMYDYFTTNNMPDMPSKNLLGRYDDYALQIWAGKVARQVLIENLKGILDDVKA